MRRKFGFGSGAGTIAIATLLMAGAPSWAEDTTARVTTFLREANDAVTAKQYDEAAKILVQAEQYPTRSGFDDFKIAEARADLLTARSSKSNNQQVAALKKVLASAYMADEVMDERARYTENLLITENDLELDPASRIALGKFLINHGYTDATALDDLAFAYLQQSETAVAALAFSDYANAGAAGTILKEYNSTHEYSEDIGNIFKGLTAPPSDIAKATANLRAEIRKGNAARKTTETENIDLSNCSIKINDKTDGGAAVKSMLANWQSVQWTGDCMESAATSPGTLIGSKSTSLGTQYKLLHAPNGLGSLSQSDLNNYQVIDEARDSDSGHYFLIPPMGTSGGSFPAAYELSSTADWVQSAMSKIGKGSLKSEHDLVVAENDRKAEEERQQQEQEEQEQAEQDAQQQDDIGNQSVFGAILGGMAQGMANSLPALQAQQQARLQAQRLAAQQQAAAQQAAAARDAQNRADQLAFQQRRQAEMQAQAAAQAQAYQQQLANQRAQQQAQQQAQQNSRPANPTSNGSAKPPSSSASQRPSNSNSSGQTQIASNIPAPVQGHPQFRDWVSDVTVGKAINFQNYGNADAYLTLTVTDCQNLQTWMCGNVAQDIYIPAGGSWSFNVQPAPDTSTQGSSDDSPYGGSGPTPPWSFRYKYVYRPN